MTTPNSATQDPELSAALGWPGGISDPVLDRTLLLQMVAALRLTSKQALEALDEADTFHRNLPDQRARRLAAMAALRAALAQQAEPVAHCELTQSGQIAFFDGKPMVMVGPVGNEHHPHPLYTAPPPPQRKSLTEEVAALTAQRDALLEALKGMLHRDERNTCRHEETHRGGAIWEICDSCGAMWADDEGGKPEWEDPKEWTQARAAIKAVKEGK